MERKRSKSKTTNKKLDYNEIKIIRKEVFDIIFVMLVFNSIFMLFMSFKGYPQIIKSDKFILILFIIWGIFTIINKNINAKNFYLYKGMSWLYVSLTCLAFCVGLLYFYMKIQSILIYILVILSYLGTLVYLAIRIKNTLLKGEEDSEKNRKRAFNIAISFASFGYVLFYVLAKHLNQSIIQMIMVSCLLYFALDFISISIYFINKWLEN